MSKWACFRLKNRRGSLYENRQIKIQSAKLPQYVQIAHDKITTPVIVSDCLFGHAPPLAVRMGVALFICIEFLGRRKLKIMCAEQLVNDCVQIHIHSAPAFRIIATFRRTDKIHRQRQPRRICCGIICLDIQCCRIVIGITMEKNLTALSIPLFQILRFTVDVAVLVCVFEDEVCKAFGHSDIGICFFSKNRSR